MYQVLKRVPSKYAWKELLIVLPTFIAALLMSGCATLDIDEYTMVEESASAADQGHYIAAGGGARSYSNHSGNSSLDDDYQSRISQRQKEFSENSLRRQNEIYETIRRINGSSGGNSSSGGRGECLDGKTVGQVRAEGGTICR